MLITAIYYNSRGERQRNTIALGFFNYVSFTDSCNYWLERFAYKGSSESHVFRES